MEVESYDLSPYYAVGSYAKTTSGCVRLSGGAKSSSFVSFLKRALAGKTRFDVTLMDGNSIFNIRGVRVFGINFQDPVRYPPLYVRLEEGSISKEEINFTTYESAYREAYLAPKVEISDAKRKLIIYNKKK